MSGDVETSLGEALRGERLLCPRYMLQDPQPLRADIACTGRENHQWMKTGK